MPTVAVAGYDVQVDARPGEPILAALCRRGYGYRFGCRRGGCGTCKVELVSGRVEYSVAVSADVLPESEHSAGICLSCRAVPVTDIEIRLADDDRLRCVAPLLLRGREKLPHQSALKGTPDQ